MKRAWIGLILLVVVLQSCDPGRLYDENKTIPSDRWYYKNRMPFDVQITDTNTWYDVSINLRVSTEYKYNNVFLWIYTTNPARQTDKRRVEIRLADEKGKWLGSGLGDIYDYQFPVLQKVKFPSSGFYRFEVEQNMREDTLSNIKSVGIRVSQTQEN